METEPLLVKPEEAAKMLGLSRSRIYAMVQCGELPSLRVGRCVRVPVERLRDWVELRQSSTEQAADAPQMKHPAK